MKAIVTKGRQDGTYDNVSMNNRAVTPTLNTKQLVRKWAREYSPKNPYRIEYFHQIFSEPFEIEFHRPINSDTKAQS